MKVDFRKCLLSSCCLGYWTLDFLLTRLSTLYEVVIIVIVFGSIVSNGNRTEWSPIRSVIIRVINKIGRPRSGSPICLITSMIAHRIGRNKVLLPINHNFKI